MSSFSGAAAILAARGGLPHPGRLAASFCCAVAALLLHRFSEGGFRRMFLLHEELERNNRKLDSLSYHDALTGIYNRRFLEETMTRELETVVLFAERVRASVAETPMPMFDMPIIPSAGVASARPDDSPAAFFERADTLPYEARRSGRNRVAAQDARAGA
ncbi:MAG: hypothetical protein NT080_08710 [Spirochaetes bacterium]|nr:hypothetical protein [Spirochaetota bacterium]